MRRAIGVAFLALATACASASDTPEEAAAGGGGSLSVGVSVGGGTEGESCSVGETRACWTGPESQRGAGDCHDGTQACVETVDGEFVTTAWGPCAGQELECGAGGGSSGGDEATSSGAGGSGPGGCGIICTGGQLGDVPIDQEFHQSNSTISTTGGGSAHWKIVGDHNVITTDGGGSCVFDVYGSNNTISFHGGGSNVVNILDGTDNTVDFSPGGGCNSVYFEHGTLTSIIPSCGWAGDGVNGEPAENMVYVLP